MYAIQTTPNHRSGGHEAIQSRTAAGGLIGYRSLASGSNQQREVEYQDLLGPPLIPAPSPDKSASKKVAAKSFILQGDAEPLSSAPVWAEPSQLLIGMWLLGRFLPPTHFTAPVENDGVYALRLTAHYRLHIFLKGESN